MITPDIHDAIVSIHSDTGVLLGTGFLVGNGMVLTARHVADSASAHRIFCSRVGELLSARVVERGESDWAVLSLDACPTGLPSIELASLQDDARRTHWSTVGHARMREGLRGAFHGVVTVHSPHELELYCEQLDGATHEDARGLSGSPCLVDGAAVGVVTDVLRRGRNGPVIARQAMALPMQRIFEEATRLPTKGRPLPWADHFAAVLGTLPESAWRNAASAAGMDPVVVSPRLPQQVARRMLGGGISVVANVLRALGSVIPSETRDELVDLAESLWVNRATAEHLLSLLRDGTPGVLTTAHDWSAKHHLFRACACCEVGVKVWLRIHVPLSHDEPFVDHVETTIRRALVDSFGSDECDVVAEDEPYTVFVQSQPRQDVVERVSATFPALRVVFVSTAAPRPDAQGIRVIAPPPDPVTEQRAQSDNRRARGLTKARPRL